MDMQNKSKVEEFFLKSINVEKIFALIERTDYFFLYNIRYCMEHSSSEQGVYLSELAEHMKMPMPDISKAAKNLENKAFIVWKTDDKKEKTYITLTDRAIDLMNKQHEKMVACYEKIVADIDKSDIETTIKTLGKVREIIAAE